MKSNSYVINGVILGIIVIVLFLIHTIFFLDFYYVKLAIIINSFLLPAIFAAYCILYLFGLKKRHNNILSFRTAFKQAYLTQVIAGIISISFIFIYFNYIDTESRDVFNYQRADINYQNAKKDIEASGDQGFKNLTKEQSKVQAEKTLSTLKEIRDNKTVNFFSFQDSFFIGFIFSVNFFYIIISLFLSLFLRNNTLN